MSHHMVLMVFLCGVLNAAAMGATSRELPPRLAEALDRNAINIGTLSMTTTSRMDPIATPAEALAALRLSNVSPDVFFRQTRISTAWQAGMLYSTSQNEHLGKRQTFELAFDGHAFYSGVPGSSIARTAAHRAHQPTHSMFSLDYLSAIGMQFPMSLDHVRVEQVPRSSIRQLLATDGQLLGINSADVDGRTLLTVSIAAPNVVQQRAMESDLKAIETRLRSGRDNSEAFIQQALERIRSQQELPQSLELQFVLDPDRGYAVVRIDERFPSGELLRRTENGSFEQVNQTGVWLPRMSSTEYYWWDTLGAEVLSEPVVRRTIRVEGSFSTVPVPAETFTLVYDEPGVWVHDNFVSDQKITFRIAAGSEDLVRAFLSLDPSYMRARSTEVPNTKALEHREVGESGVVTHGIQGSADHDQPVVEGAPGGAQSRVGIWVASCVVLGLGIAIAVVVLRRFAA